MIKIASSFCEAVMMRLTQKVSFCFFYEGREVQEDNNGKLNPSHSCGAGSSRSQGHGRPWFSLCYPPEPLHRN